MNTKASPEKILAARKQPCGPTVSYNMPLMYGPRPTASVVASIRYPNASPKRFLGSTAEAIVTIAFAVAPKPIP